MTLKRNSERFTLKMNSAEKLDDKGKVWKVVIAEAGPTLNKIFIPGETLEQSVSMFEESRLMWFELKPGQPNHLPIRIAEEVGEAGGAAGNFVGVIKNVRFVEGAGTHGLGELQADAHIWSEPLRLMLLELDMLGILSKQIGLSFFVDLPEDGSGMVESDDPDKGDFILQSIKKVRSTDVVLDPAAGGKFKAIAASIKNEYLQEVIEMKKILKQLRKIAPQCVVAMSEEVKDEAEQVAKSLDKAIVKMASNREILQLLLAAKVALESGESDEVSNILTEAIEAIEAQVEQEEMARKQSEKDEAEKNDPPKEKQKDEESTSFSKEEVEKLVADQVKAATEKVAMSQKIENAVSKASGLSEHSKAHARQVLMSLDNVTEAKISETIRSIGKIQGLDLDEDEKETTAQMAKVGKTEKDKLFCAMSYLMGGHDEKEELPWRPSRLSEVVSAFGFEQSGQGLRFTPGKLTKSLQMSVTSGDLANALSDSMNRRILKIASNSTQYWRQVVSNIKNVPDFRSQEIVQVDGLEDFKTKASEIAGYDEVVVSPSDDKRSYAVDERGAKFTITRKVWVNDDLSLVRTFIDKMTRSGLRTLDRFIFRLLIGDTPTAPAGPNTRDFGGAVTLYHASRNNIITTALDSDSISAFKRLLAKQTEYGQDALELMLSLDTLIYPIELAPQANVIAQSQQKPGTANNDANIHRGIRNFLEVPTGLLGGDVNNYYGMASPNQIDTIEVGFLNGQQTPWVHLQDVRTAEPMLLTGNMTAVGQFDFGAEIIEPKAVVGAIVP